MEPGEVWLALKSPPSIFLRDATSTKGRVSGALQSVNSVALYGEGKDNELEKLCARRTLLAYLTRHSNSRAQKDEATLPLLWQERTGQFCVITDDFKLVVGGNARVLSPQESIPTRERIKGHDVRNILPPDEICDAGTWTAECRFAKLYRLVLHHQGS